MKRCYSLKRNKEFRHAYRVGKSVGTKPLVLIYSIKKSGGVRIGFSVSKKLGNAVVRNRIKRRLREAVTPIIPCVRDGHNLIFIARTAAVEAEFSKLASAMRYMLRKADLLIANPLQEESK